MESRTLDLVILAVVFMIGWSAAILYISLDEAPERLSPKDRLRTSDIHGLSSGVLLDVRDARFAVYSDTNSMDPLLDENTHGIEVKPTSPHDISVGDVISYKSELTGSLVVHRVVAIGQEDSNYFYTVQGDNNELPDPQRVHFDQIQGVLVGVLY